MLLEDVEYDANGTLLPATVGYRAVVIADRVVSVRALNRLVGAAQSGLRIVFLGDLPTTPVSHGDADTDLGNTLAQLLALPSVVRVETAADVAGALADLSLSPRVDTRGTHLLVQVRDLDSRRVALLYNPADQPVRAAVNIEGAGIPSVIDLWTGSVTACVQYRADQQRTTVPVVVPPRGCTVIILDLTRDPAAGDAPLHVVDEMPHRVHHVEGQLVLRPRRPAPGDSASPTLGGTRHRSPRRAHGRLCGSLHLAARCHDGRTTGQSRTIRIDELPTLADWRALGELAGEAGTGTYEGTFTIPADWFGADRGVELDLGHVAGTARIQVNGQNVADLVGESRRVDVTPQLRPGANTLRVVVASVLRNAVTHHRGTSTRTAEVGLRGPVTFTPYVDVPISTTAQHRRKDTQ